LKARHTIRFGENIRAILQRDPAARNAFEVILTNPGLHAVWNYRQANFLWRCGLKTLARLWAYMGRSISGVEIHPAAQIGRRLVIDHGMGVVIGETSIIGDDVLIYHSVTLGSKTGSRGKRHPTIGNNVVLGAQAIVLGNITVGDGASIGAATLVVRDVAPSTTVVGNPAKVL
jgi:serine O-acetyltransferase